MNPRELELLAPAGDFEKLQIAVHYGADAVYFSDRSFSLRNFSTNFSFAELSKAIQYAHHHGVKAYVACNIFARSDEIKAIRAYLDYLGKLGPDGVIIADPGVFALARKIIPHIPIHLSTQANTTNLEAARFWEGLGASRINLARELSLAEIHQIRCNTDLEIETFVHGAMCIAYSGRCLLSSFMEKRPGNRGECCQPCRFHYTLMEEKRPGQYYPFAEDERGSYLFNSRDLCMIDHLPELMAAGIGSLKIEGRMKGIHYVGTVVKIYREALDAYAADPRGYAVQEAWHQELAKINHRGYCTGFYLGDPEAVVPNYAPCRYDTPYRFVGKVVQGGSSWFLMEARNKVQLGDPIEALPRKGPLQSGTIQALYDREGDPLAIAQPGTLVRVHADMTVQTNDLIRKRPPGGSENKG